MKLAEGHCELCDAVGALLDGMCEDCCSTDHGGPLSPWMVRLLFEETGWVNHNAWREYLDAALARRGSEDDVDAWNLAGDMTDHVWARRLLEELAQEGWIPNCVSGAPDARRPAPPPAGVA